MLDSVNLNPPPVLKELEESSRAINFTMGSDHLTGSLLRTLAANKPAGLLLDLGTGTGFSCAWMLDGMDDQARIISVDINQEVTAIPRLRLGHDQRVTFVTMDGAEFITSMRQQHTTFDLIFADMTPGKYSHLDETLSLLKAGGLYVIDDLLFLTDWVEAHVTRVYHLVKALEARKDLHITRLNWSTGLIIAAKK